MPLPFGSADGVNPKQVDLELRERAFRLVREHRTGYPSVSKAIAAVTRQELIGSETRRRWVIQADIDAGDRDGRGPTPSFISPNVLCSHGLVTGDHTSGDVHAHHHRNVECVHGQACRHSRID